VDLAAAVSAAAAAVAENGEGEKMYDLRITMYDLKV
jgi:hypothetical protein